MFHVELDGETTWSTSREELFHGKLDSETTRLVDSEIVTDFDEGFLLGILVGEGHFGGDGRQPQVTLRMHVRHEDLFRWLLAVIPGSVLYGPYHHGGRNYYQWMTRGKTLRDELLPILLRRLDTIDTHVRHRVEEMIGLYRLAEKAGGEWHVLESPEARPARPRRQKKPS